MEIKVESIEGMDIVDNDKIKVRVLFHKETEDGYGFGVKATVWLPKRDALVSEIKKEAIHAAIDLLKEAQTSHYA